MENTVLIEETIICSHTKWCFDYSIGRSDG